MPNYYRHPRDLADDEVEVINESSTVTSSLTPAIRMAVGRRPLPSAAVYYRYADQPLQYPFDWRGFPGGQPASRPAGETRELGLAGAGVVDSGLNPYTTHFPPLRRRLLTPGRDALAGPGGGCALAGILSDLSDSERKLAMVAGAAIAGVVAWRHLRGKRKRGR